MADALARHDAVLRESISGHHGYVFTTAGDAFCAAFDDAAQALDAAISAQRRLRAGSRRSEIALRVRMGLHTGIAEERDGDYFGSTVNRCARLMSAAHGGQVVLSDATAALVEDRFDLRNLGEHLLKDLDESQAVFQLIADGLEDSFPPLSSAADLAPPTNLPAPINRFVGREAELVQLDELLRDHRLVTITGSAGAGKSRLAYEMGRRLLYSHPDGAWIVELADLSDGELIDEEIITALGLDAPISRSPVDAICEQLSRWTALLVIDNCEHVLADSARIIHRVLRAAPGVRIIATSRAPLGIAGEAAWRLPLMTLPSKEMDDDAKVAVDSCRFFIERARAARPDVDFSTRAGEVADLCCRLEGIPLCMELAAARLVTMSIDDVAERLDDRLRLLSGGDATGPAHHRTLMATVDWSYQLLGPEEQEVYRRLAVFRGGWTVAAAESVCVSERIAPERIFDSLHNLAANSMIVIEPREEGTRFSMLETMREHGLALLVDADESEPARLAHFEWVCALAAAAGPAVDGAEQAKWLHTLDLELENIRASIDWAATSGQASVALCAISQIFRYFWLHSRLQQGAEWLDQLMAAGRDIPPDVEARALYASGFLISLQGRTDEAMTRLRRSVALFRDLDDQRGLAWALHYLGRVAWEHDPADELLSYQQEALELFSGLADGQGIFLSKILKTAVTAILTDDVESASEQAKELLVLADAVGAPNALAHAHESQAWAADLETDAALGHYRRALDYYRDLGNRDCAAHCMSGIAHTLAREGLMAEAAELVGAVEAIHESLSMIPPAYERALFDHTFELLDEQEPKAREAGRRLTFHEAMDRAAELVCE